MLNPSSHLSFRFTLLSPFYPLFVQRFFFKEEENDFILLFVHPKKYACYTSYPVQMFLNCNWYMFLCVDISCWQFFFPLLIKIFLFFSDCSKAIENCIRCESTGAKCVKCRNLIVFGTRQCVESCPMGYRQQWSPYDDYMGQICIETSFIASLGVTGETFTILVGAFTGKYLISC